MKPEEILELIRAGYSKADIDAMTGKQEPPKQEPPKQEPPKQTPADEINAPVLAAIQALTQTLQAANIGNSQQPEQMTTDEILAQIIAPPVMNKKEE